MGLERLFKATFKTTPQFDMDKQTARTRIPEAMTLDFAALADGIRRNNVGTVGFLLDATVVVKDGMVEIQPTGQKFALDGAAPADPGPAKRKLRVLEWGDPEKTKVRLE
jgi:hypothetical protein